MLSEAFNPPSRPHGVAEAFFDHHNVVKVVAQAPEALREDGLKYYFRQHTNVVNCIQKITIFQV